MFEPLPVDLSGWLYSFGLRVEYSSRSQRAVQEYFDQPKIVKRRPPSHLLDSAQQCFAADLQAVDDQAMEHGKVSPCDTSSLIRSRKCRNHDEGQEQREEP